MHAESAAAAQSASTHALEYAHALAFRNGLGRSLYADTHATASITPEDVHALHARAVSNPSGVAVLGTGISTESLAQLLESSYSSHKKTTTATTAETTPVTATAYHGGATRIASQQQQQQALFVGFGSTASTSIPALHALSAHLNPTPSLKWSNSTSPLASSIPSSISAQSILLPYSDAALIGVMLAGTDASALKEAAKAVVQSFKDVAQGKGVGKEEMGRATARAKFQLAAALEGRDGFVGAFGPKVLKGEKASVQETLDDVQGVSATGLSRVRVLPATAQCAPSHMLMCGGFFFFFFL